MRDQADTSACKTRNRGYVYFVQAEHGGPVKIGWALDPLRRLEQLQTGHPDTLVVRRLVRGDRIVEARLHRHYADARLRGEWFALEGYERRQAFSAESLKLLALTDHLGREGLDHVPSDPTLTHLLLKQPPSYSGELPDHVEGESWSMP